MADQKNRGGQKSTDPEHSEADQKRGENTGGMGKRLDRDKQRDQKNNPDDADREPTNLEG